MPASSRRRLPLWFMMLLFLAASVSVSAISHSRRQAAPKNLAQLAERIRATHPEWHLTLANPDSAQGLEAGFWICTQECSLADLPSLVWRGVVMCRRNEDNAPQDWGERGLVTDELFVYGDPDLLEQIAPLISPH